MAKPGTNYLLEEEKKNAPMQSFHLECLAERYAKSQPFQSVLFIRSRAHTESSSRGLSSYFKTICLEMNGVVFVFKVTVNL